MIQLQYGNVIHRDLKPDNIMIKILPDTLSINTSNPTEGQSDHLSQNVYIIDFGFSINLKNTNPMIASLTCGTCGYISPEFFREDPNSGGGSSKLIPIHATHKSDIYSCGLIFYEM